MKRISFSEADKIVSHVVFRYQGICPWLPKQDLYQEAWVGILSAKGYDENRGSLKNYLFRAAANRVLKFIIRFSNPVGAYKFLSITSEPYVESACPLPSPEEHLSYTQASEIIYYYVRDACDVTKQEARYALLVLAGSYKSREAASELAVAPSQMYRLVKNARRQIKKETRNHDRPKNKTQTSRVRNRLREFTHTF